MNKIDRYVIDYSLKNGLGHPSISLYLTGCDKPIKCEDCHNWELQKQSENNYNINTIKDELDNSIKNYLSFHDKLYFSILGGEPLSEYNKDISLEISKYIKEKYKKSIIVLYSWRLIEEIKDSNLIPYTLYMDYGVLGPYKKDLYEEKTLPSSSNQYVYNFKTNKKLKPIKIK